MMVRHTFPAHPSELQAARKVVSKACTDCGCTESMTTDIVIAVGEAIQNVVRHAYKDIEDGEATLEIVCKDGIIEFRLQDSAPTADPEKLKPEWPEEPGPGGLGICLIHDIMDEVEHLPAPSGQGNLLRMVKFIESNRNET
jgi:sigma-B regulation protein RsbU (phosphoserine phosphatase)